MISDERVLAVARELFRARGHTVTTRDIAEALGISEPVLYQRFASKDDLFFAAMRPHGPDIDKVLGPPEPPDDAHAFLRAVVVRIENHFAEVIPLALRIMNHPSFDDGSIARSRPTGAEVLREALAQRLASLSSRKSIRPTSVTTTARLLVSLAHDSALGNAMSPMNPSQRARLLREMVDSLWEGLRP
jgi:AcrR family transcriptional regulator